MIMLDFHRDFEQSKQGTRFLDNVKKSAERLFPSDVWQAEHFQEKMEATAKQ